MLPIGGLLIGLLYHYYGKNVVAGNHLLLDTIHEPKAIIPFKMAPFVYFGNTFIDPTYTEIFENTTIENFSPLVVNNMSDNLTTENRNIKITRINRPCDVRAATLSKSPSHPPGAWPVNFFRL